MIVYVSIRNLLYDARGGGAQTTLRTLLGWHAETGRKAVHLCRSWAHGSEVSPGPKPRILVIPFLPFQRFRAIRHIDDALFTLVLLAVCRWTRAQAVYAYSERAIARPLVWMRRLSDKTKLVVRLAGPSWAQKADEKPARLDHYKRLFQGADGINCLSEVQRDNFIRQCDERGIKMAREKTIVADILREPEYAGSFSVLRRGPLAPIRIAMAGRMTVYQKRQDLLVEAAALLSLQTPIILTFFGEGQRMDSLRKMAQDRRVAASVRFAGNVDQQSYHAGLLDHDIYCLATDYEGTSKALLEALAIGIPCLASNVDPIASDFSDLARDGGIGLVDNTPEAWANEILLLKADTEQRQRMSDLGLAFVSDRFTGRHVFEDMISKIVS